MKRGLQGHFVQRRIPGESFRAYIPRDLPPEPPLTLDSDLYDVLERANRALGRVGGMSMLLPDISLFFIFTSVRKRCFLHRSKARSLLFSDLLLLKVTRYRVFR